MLRSSNLFPTNSLLDGFSSCVVLWLVWYLNHQLFLQAGNQDTINSIALKFNVTPNKLVELNKLFTQTIVPGQVNLFIWVFLIPETKLFAMYLKAFYYLHVSFRYLDTRIMDSNLKPSLKVKLSRLLVGIGVGGEPL